MWLLTFVFFWVAFCIATAIYAEGRGRNGAAFFCFAILASPLVAFIFAAASPPTDKGGRRCPFCAESVKLEAMKCKHCGSELPKRQSRATEIPATLPRQ